jgi:MFS family permease
LSVIPVVIHDTLGIAFVGVLTSCFYVIPIFASYAVGNQSDIRGRRVMLMGAGLAGTSGLIALNFSNIPLMLVAGVVLLAVCNAMIFPVMTALAGDVATKTNLESLVSLFRVVQGAGTVAGLLLAAVIHGTDVFAVSLAVLVTCFAISLPVFRQDIPDIRRRIATEIG